MKKFFLVIIIIAFAPGSRGQTPADSCLPLVDTLLYYVPWFPINNTGPATSTVNQLLGEINDKAAVLGITDTLQKMSLYCSRGYAFLPRGSGADDSLKQLWLHNGLSDKVDMAYRCRIQTVCTENALFGEQLFEAGFNSIAAHVFSMGDSIHGHMVTLVEYQGHVYYYDLLNNITLRRADGNHLDFRVAYNYLVRKQYDSVELHVLPQYFGPDYQIIKPGEIGQHIISNNKTQAEMQQDWPSTFSYSFDSSFFCTRDSTYALGFYKGNHWATWQADLDSLAGKTAVLDYIEGEGFEREVLNWWRTNPVINDPYLQNYIDSLNLLFPANWRPPRSLPPVNNSGPIKLRPVFPRQQPGIEIVPIKRP